MSLPHSPPGGKDRTTLHDVTRTHPCVICAGVDRCRRGEDGLILCLRAPSLPDVFGYVCLGRSTDGAWTQYRAEGDPHLANGKSNHSTSGKSHTGDGHSIDWTAEAKRYAKALTPALRDELAEALGLPVSALDACPLLGWRSREDCWTFPEVDGAGKIIGILRRYRDGHKLSMDHGLRGLIVPPSWQEGDGPLYIPEGPSDVLAGSALGLRCIGRPNNVGGAARIAELLGSLPAERRPEVIVLGEYDPKPDGKWPGLEGAKKVSSGLSERLGDGWAISWAMPPDGAKDVRAWAIEQDLDPALSDAWSVAGERFEAGIKRQKAATSPAAGAITAADLVGMTLPEPRWAVEGILPEGMSMLAGKPKLGKSWLAMNLALAVGHGGVALNSITVEQGAVLYLALEDTRRRLQSRLKKMLAATLEPAPDRLTLATTWPRQDKGGAAAIQEWCQAHSGARLVIIDTWAKFRPPKQRGRDCYEEDYEHAAQVKALADSVGVAILVLHHCRKIEAADPVDSVSGTLGLTGCADGVLVMQRERGQHDATLFVTGRDIEEQEMALKWDVRYALWSILGDADEYRVSQDRQEVLQILREAGRPMSPAEVAPLIGKTPNAAKQLLYKMSRSGMIRSTGSGRYECAQADTADT